MVKKDVKNFTLEELAAEMEKNGEPPYRAKQIFFWLYKKGRLSFDGITNIPDALKKKLNAGYCITSLHPAKRLKSSDGTEKFLFKLRDDNFVETVLIRNMARTTICLSTQIGCRYACSFCASGAKGFTRDLNMSEILNQALFTQRSAGSRITNFVFMGMGEPLDNYENVSRSILVMTDADGMAVPASKITVSTCGIPSGINALKTLGAGVNLSLSVHAALDDLRSRIMPVNRLYPLKDVIKACQNFVRTGRGRLTFEYALIKEENDSPKDAEELAALAKKLNAKINLLAYNAIPQCAFRPSDRKTVAAFIARLKKCNVTATLRRSKGSAIAAACGQLAGETAGTIVAQK